MASYKGVPKLKTNGMFGKWRVEKRGAYYICTNEIVEIAPIFEARVTAYEVLDSAINQHPFFKHIPVLPAGSRVPRTHEDEAAWARSGREAFKVQI